MLLVCTNWYTRITLSPYSRHPARPKIDGTITSHDGSSGVSDNCLYHIALADIPVMATALVGSPTSESRAEQERQFSHHEDGLQREVEHVEALQATQEMCAYCFGAFWMRLRR